MKTGPKPRPLADRFWQKVAKTETCWLWTGATARRGYGILAAGWGKTPHQAHRLSWELHFGAIPEGACVLHHCDTPGCVRPDHLFLGSKRDNCLDMLAKGRGRWQVAAK